MSPSDRPQGKVLLQGANAATEIYLVDSSFGLVASGLAQLKRSCGAGIYKARFKLGSAFKDVPFELPPGGELVQGGPELIAPSAAPLPWTGSRDADGLVVPLSPERRQALWHSAAGCRPKAGQGVLQVMLRGPRRNVEVRAAGGRSPFPLQWREVAGARVAALRLRAGTHVLSIQEDGEWLCRAVPVLAGQQTTVAIEVPTSSTSSGTGLYDASQLIAPHPIAGTEEELLLQDMAQQALEARRALLSPGDILAQAGRLSPFLLLLAAHGVVEAKRSVAHQPLEPLRFTEEERAAVLKAHELLRRTELGGSADVAALALAAGEKAGTVDLRTPPLLSSTWRTLVAMTSPGDGWIRGGGGAALRIAEGLKASALWLIWGERPAHHGRRPLAAAMEALRESDLRASAGRVPSWVDAQPLAEVVGRDSRAAARGLHVPVPLVLRLAKDLDDRRARRRKELADRRARALSSPRARVCLVALPDGVRVDPQRGQPIDFDAVFTDLVEPAAWEQGLVAVRAPPVDVHSDEMRDAVANADLLVADLTSAEPAVAAAIGACVARGCPVVQIKAEGHPAAAAGEVPAHGYVAAFGTGLSFHFPDAFAAAVERGAGAPGRPRSRERSRWLRALAGAEKQRLALHRLRRAQVARDPGPADGRARLIARLRLRAAFRRAFPDRALRRAHPWVQLDAFLLCKARSDFAEMERVWQCMAPALQGTVVVREQRALALNRTGQPELAVQLLESVLGEIGLNGETCGLLGRVHKDRWEEAEGKKETPQSEQALELAIHWYREGCRASPLDPYPGVNLLTLLALKGTGVAMEEHARMLPLVEDAALRRLRVRPGYWDLASMLEIAAHKRDQGECEWYRRQAVGAPHDRWMVETTARNLRLLARSRAPGFEGAASWLAALAEKLEAGISAG
ncbi:MAG TPA: TRAFs-binding domain-containing protein [Myxococcales bacterium]|nr:TRAFs-binding domain-containing protein [Myxococcales bacterium]